MSDQDFFFDDEVTEAPKAAKAPKQAKPAVKPAQPAKAAKTAVVVEESEGLVFGLAVVVLVAIVALLIGVIGGIFIGKGLAPAADFGTPEAGTSGMGSMGGMGGGNAPTLTDEQMQGGMPSGHPPVDGAGTDAGATGGDAPVSNEGEMPAGHPPVDGESTGTEEPAE